MNETAQSTSVFDIFIKALSARNIQAQTSLARADAVMRGAQSEGVREQTRAMREQTDFMVQQRPTILDALKRLMNPQDDVPPVAAPTQQVKPEPLFSIGRRTTLPWRL